MDPLHLLISAGFPLCEMILLVEQKIDNVTGYIMSKM